MYFCNPEIIQTMNDVKLGMIETASKEISYLDLLDGIRFKLIGLITVDVDQIVINGDVSREEAVGQVAKRVYDMLEFFENKEVTSEEELADAIMEMSKPFDLWKMRTWDSFKAVHKGKIEKDSPIASQGVLKMDESAVNDALEELTFEGFLEVLKNYE